MQEGRGPEVPENLVICIFIMLYKNKGSHNDCSKYRTLGLLNHAYKIMSVECRSFAQIGRRVQKLFQ